MESNAPRVVSYSIRERTAAIRTARPIFVDSRVRSPDYAFTISGTPLPRSCSNKERPLQLWLKSSGGLRAQRYGWRSATDTFGRRRKGKLSPL
jgi:hypothetical protein